jgi:hypothetical protein
MWDDSTCDRGETEHLGARPASQPGAVPEGGHGTVAGTTGRMDGPVARLYP